RKTAVLTGLNKPAAKLTFAADGHTLAALAADGLTIQVWELKRNTAVCQINHNRGTLGVLALSADGKMLAATAADGKTVLIWKVAARELSHKGPPLDLSAKELAGLWTELASPDADKSDAAWRKLGAAGDNAIPFLRQQIRPIAAPAVDMKQIEKWVAELDSDKFATREKAAKELLTVGEPAVGPLQRLLKQSPSPSPEAEKRANLVLKQLGEPTLTPERQRVLEAIELLEQVRTAQAIGLLEEIERDALLTSIRLAAREALERVTPPAGQKK
ncbi:MAG TPA: hypothetical protein VG099_29595, partial [Gemmataceae bacterium]|nr:hypothetical protein [Gemmataceae bacterium]